MIKHGEVWTNKLNELVRVVYDDSIVSKYPYHCYHITTGNFAFSVNKEGIWNTRFKSDTDLTKKITKEEYPEYFL